MSIASPLPHLYVARVETSGRLAEFYDEYCLQNGDEECTSWLDADQDRAIIEYFHLSRAEAEQRLAGIETILDAHRGDDPLTGDVRELPAQDWSETWKRFFHPEKVSPRLWIKPTWESCQAGAGECVVEIDPGMSFGTGQHATTQGCLILLDRLATPGHSLRLADIGCGSGILAIAACKLGYREVAATDNDPDAVRIARENARLNGVEEHIRFSVGDCRTPGMQGTHDVVVANILAGVLIEHAPSIMAPLVPSPFAALVLSGILNSQAIDVVEAYQKLGVICADRLQRGEWTTLLMRFP